MKYTIPSDPKTQYTLVDVIMKNNQRSVYAKYYIENKTIIECDAELLKNEENFPLFEWDKSLTKTLSYVFCVGFGFYLKRQHENSNIRVKKIDKERMKIYFETTRAIRPNEELLLTI